MRIGAQGSECRALAPDPSARRVGWRLVYGVNAQIRRHPSANTSSWNPVNAKDVLHYSIAHGYADNLDFEFGNRSFCWYRVSFQPK